MPKKNQNDNFSKKQAAELCGTLLAWYNTNKRSLPWRDVNDPYKTWLSEIMLQQTTVQAVKPYYEKFLQRWPTVQHLAQATQDDVMHEWAGLGYYSRARNLHKCAQIIDHDHNGIFPHDQAALKKLPGVGDYTSAAIRTIAFNLPATVVDGNIERIISRHRAITQSLPAAKKTIAQTVAPLFTHGHSGDIAQALMDLGATICTPKSPQCSACPINTSCIANANNTQTSFPVKAKKKTRPSKKGFVYWIENDSNQILLHRRPERGLLAATLGLPTSDWAITTPDHLSFDNITPTTHTITHVFTHFDLELTLCRAKSSRPSNSMAWHNKNAKTIKGMPSLFMKVYKQAMLNI